MKMSKSLSAMLHVHSADIICCITISAYNFVFSCTSNHATKKIHYAKRNC